MLEGVLGVVLGDMLHDILIGTWAGYIGYRYLARIWLFGETTTHVTAVSTACAGRSTKSARVA